MDDGCVLCMVHWQREQLDPRFICMHVGCADSLTLSEKAVLTCLQITYITTS